METNLQAERPGFNSRQRQKCDSFPPSPRPDRLWFPLSLLSTGYRVPLRRGQSDLHLVTRVRMCGVMPPLPHMSSRRGA
jgi:hypothetical protein